MLRIIVLLLTHLGVFGAGAGMAVVTLRGRRQELIGKAAVLDTRETVLGARMDQLLHVGQPLSTPAHEGRHRAPSPAAATVRACAKPAPASRYLTAGLDEAVALNVTAIAEHEQMKRVFVDIMTNIAQSKAWHQGTARVPTSDLVGVA